MHATHYRVAIMLTQVLAPMPASICKSPHLVRGTYQINVINDLVLRSGGFCEEDAIFGAGAEPSREQPCHRHTREARVLVHLEQHSNASIIATTTTANSSSGQAAF